MKRSRFPRRAKQTPDTEQLIQLATNLSLSSSHIEGAFWETRLAVLIHRILGDGDEGTLTAALDHLYGAGGRAYDELADLTESCCETTQAGPETGESDVLMFAAPMLVWSRYTIPSGPIPAETLDNLRVQLQAHAFAKDVRLGLADYLFSPDQLPQSYCDTARLREKLAKCGPARARPQARRKPDAGNRELPVRHPLCDRRRT